MEYTYLGRTGLKVSRMCLGTMNFGPSTDEKESFRIMDMALERGINFFDTANMYGGIPGKDIGYRGWTEEIIGRWFKQGGGRREKVILATKIFEKMNDETYGPNDEPGLSGFKIRRHTEDCLRRMQTDHVEIMYMHGMPPHAGWDEVWGAFEPLVDQGKIYYVASSNFGARHVIYAQNAAEKRNFLGIVADQMKYNLICRLPEVELIPTLRDLGMGFLAWSPLQGGMLSGSILKNIESNQRSSKYIGKVSEARLAQLREYSKLCGELGASEADVATAWLLSRPTLTAPIIGPRTAEQFEDSLKAIDLVLPEDFLKRLEEIFPGPGGEAPRAYFG